MLTKKDLRWNYTAFSLYSKLNLIPVKFIPNFLLGGPRQMDSEASSLWRKMAFKLIQILYTAHTIFMSFRSVQCAVSERKEETGAELNSEFVPIMLILSFGYFTFDLFLHFTFGSGRALNSKIYNEILKLRGKPERYFIIINLTVKFHEII